MMGRLPVGTRVTFVSEDQKKLTGTLVYDGPTRSFSKFIEKDMRYWYREKDLRAWKRGPHVRRYTLVNSYLVRVGRLFYSPKEIEPTRQVRTAKRQSERTEVR